MSMVKNNIHRISDLVKDLLAYSKERRPQYEATDPNILAEEVCTLFEIKANEKSIAIERQFDPNLGKMVNVFLDQRGIHTCLSNLVSNAIDACEMAEKRSLSTSLSEQAKTVKVESFLRSRTMGRG